MSVPVLMSGALRIGAVSRSVKRAEAVRTCARDCINASNPQTGCASAGAALVNRQSTTAISRVLGPKIIEIEPVERRVAARVFQSRDIAGHDAIEPGSGIARPRRGSFGQKFKMHLIV